ncbi:MAG: T9SS type A sorting domain-containing protein [Paludibacter sp.]|nr:T9SS type A sorting domain-containing protein [Paludibacter sp.]
MKKNYKKMLSILCGVLISVSAFAQGTWKATGTEVLMPVSTAITTGITGLTVMHSDADATTGVIGKTDTGAPTVTYDGVTWDNEAIIQGSTNGMYYALRPTSNGVIQVSGKMGNNKATFFLQLTTDCPDNADLVALTTNLSTGGAITGTPAYFTLPQVFNSSDNTTNTWDGTVSLNTTGANLYTVMTFNVTANTTYLFGVNGSKFMLRGISYKLSTGIAPLSANKKSFSLQNPAKGNVILKVNESVKIGIYNTVGVLLSQKLVSPTDNNVDISRLVSGVYFVKDMNNAYKTQKLIIE